MLTILAPSRHLIAAMLLCATAGAFADDAGTFARTVSGSELALPKIPGFGDPDAVPLYRQHAIESTFRGARLLAFYPAVAPDLSGASASGRYIVVLTARSPTPAMSLGEFEKFKSVMRESAVAAVRRDLPSGSDEAAAIAEMRRRLDASQLRLADGAELLLGVVDEQPHVLSLVSVQKPPQAAPIAQVMTQVIVKGATLNVYATSPYRSQQDVRWALGVTKTWLAALDASNTK